MGGIGLHDPDPDQIGMLITKVIHLNLLGNQIVVVLSFDLLTIQLYQPGNYDDFLLYCDL